MKTAPCFPPWLRRRRLAASVLLLLSVAVLLQLRLRLRLAPPPPGHAPLRRHDVNCSAIYELEPLEVAKSLVIRRAAAPDRPDADLAALTSDCAAFLRRRGYADACASEEERGFPLAFSLVVHKAAWRVERLLRALYAPSNIYCLHYDRKSTPAFAAAMEGVARCLPNVFVASRREAVFYADVSRLRADLHCLADLLRSPVAWRYAINLCGQDFPLRSNAQLVGELRRLGGANMLETCRPTAAKRLRFAFRHQLRAAADSHQLPLRTAQEKAPPPHGVQVFTGSAYFVLSRAFVLHLNASPVARDFLSWCEDTFSPDEHFWATLVRLPGVPGEVARSQPDVSDLASRTRLVKWEYLEGALYPPCTGTHLRSVCVFGAAELRWLLDSGHWFANKVDRQVDPVLVQCLEEELQRRQRLLLQAREHLSCPLQPL